MVPQQPYMQNVHLPSVPKTTASNTKINIDQSCESNTSKSNNKTFNYNIDSIVYENPKTNIQVTTIENKSVSQAMSNERSKIDSQTVIPLENKDCELKLSANKSLSQQILPLELKTESKIDRSFHKENTNNNKDEITLLNILGLNKDFTKRICVNATEDEKDFSQYKSTVFGNSNLPELSALVKHGSTPVNNSRHKTFSPQLPAPSPNYPVQSQVTQNIVDSAKDNHKTILTGSVPVNNSYMNTFPTTSQTCTDSITSDSVISSENKNKLEIEKNEVNMKIEVQKFEGTKCNPQIKKENGKIMKPCLNNLKIKSHFTILNVPKFRVPSFKRKQLSKIDLACLKKKMRREKKIQKPKRNNKLTDGDSNVTKQFGVRVYGYSDSSSSSSSDTGSDCEDSKYDTWIKSGPPLKPNYTAEKLCFLQVFGLTTHMRKNSLELQKLERRKWLQVQQSDDNNESDRKVCPLNLPVPSNSPSILNHTTDYKKKSNFLQVLGLSNVPVRTRDDIEKNWMKIMEERLRRNHESPLTCYSLIYHQKQKGHMSSESNALLRSPSVHFKIPSVHRLSNLGAHRISSAGPTHVKSIEINVPYFQYTRDRTKDCANSSSFKAKQSISNNRFKWPGIQEIMESYQVFSKDRQQEIETLTKQNQALKEEAKAILCQERLLVKKQRGLNSALFLMEQEKKRLQKETYYLKNIIDAFR
ncbi:hypothetical protein WA026_002216 [Henosepilachna vigintioctopunctata]|uniref:Genetic suppressor element-like domain-containing protein n=1 Tax=Henosepilachna vigintioctopunctata TaxID=420089 RepID=A0AAW1TSW6_9CUCU